MTGELDKAVAELVTQGHTHLPDGGAAVLHEGGRVAYVDPVEAQALDDHFRAVDPNPLPATVALIVANIHKLNGGDPGAMTRLDYLRQGSSFMALSAPLSPAPRVGRRSLGKSTS